MVCVRIVRRYRSCTTATNCAPCCYVCNIFNVIRLIWTRYQEGVVVIYPGARLARGAEEEEEDRGLVNMNGLTKEKAWKESSFIGILGIFPHQPNAYVYG